METLKIFAGIGLYILVLNLLWIVPLMVVARVVFGGRK